MDVVQHELFRDAKWQAFDAATDHDQAARRFEERHGVKPAIVWTSGPVVLAGPIPLEVRHE